MELFFCKEVKDKKELKEALKQYPELSDEYEVAVIVCAFDAENRIIFQRRGPACRDERFKLETIGGRVKETDSDFRAALHREIVEEVGNEAEIQIGELITATYATTFDERAQAEQNWIYLLYRGELKNGNLQITEPDKNLGYERYQIGEVEEEQLSSGARELYHIVSRKYGK